MSELELAGKAVTVTVTTESHPATLVRVKFRVDPVGIFVPRYTAELPGQALRVSELELGVSATTLTNNVESQPDGLVNWKICVPPTEILVPL